MTSESSLSQTDRASKFCMDAGLKSVVESGQYFMTKDNGEQFYAKVCRECTLPREDGSSQPRGWIQGNTKIGPVLEVSTSCLYGKHGVEIRIWSLSEDNTLSLVRSSHGSNKFVIDSNNTITESPEDLPEEQASQLKVKDLQLDQRESKTTKRGTCRLFTKHHSDEWKKVDGYWTRKFFFLCERGIGQRNPSSSTLSNSTTRRRFEQFNSG